MKRVLVLVAMLSLVLSGITFAGDQDKEESITVGPVQNNSYVYISPEDDQAKVPPETVQKLMDQGVIPAAEGARLNTQGSGIQK